MVNTCGVVIVCFELRELVCGFPALFVALLPVCGGCFLSPFGRFFCPGGGGFFGVVVVEEVTHPCCFWVEAGEDVCAACFFGPVLGFGELGQFRVEEGESLIAVSWASFSASMP